MNGNVLMQGKLLARVIHPPGPGLAWKLRNALRWDFILGLIGMFLAKSLTRLTGIPTLVSSLRVRKLAADGQMIDYGVVGRRVVTDAFAEFMVDQLQTESSAWGDFKYHDSGVGTTAADVTDTDIETTDGESRATGSQTEGANPNEYVSVGTITYSTTKAITEHGLFNASSSGVLLDRHTFSAINVVDGDSIQFTYTLEVTSGG